MLSSGYDWNLRKYWLMTWRNSTHSPNIHLLVDVPDLVLKMFTNLRELLAVDADHSEPVDLHMR